MAASSVKITSVPREADFFQQFFEMKEQERKKIIDQYKKNFLDFDNDIIVKSALKVLTSLGMDREKLLALRVGPERAGGDWNLGDQLNTQFKLGDYTSKNYILLSVPTNSGKHSIPAVICKSKQRIYCFDPLANSLFLKEACTQLQTAVDNVPALKGYPIITPPKGYLAQQIDGWSCGIHSSADIVGIILDEEIKNNPSLFAELSSDPKHKILLDTVIDVPAGRGIAPRTREQLNTYLGIFCLAYTEYGHELEAMLSVPRLMSRQYKHLEIPVRSWVKSNSDAASFNSELIMASDKAKDIERAVRENRKPTVEVKPLTEFITDYIGRNPTSPIKVLLESKELIDTIPMDMETSTINRGIELTEILNDFTLASLESNDDNSKLPHLFQRNIRQRREEEYKGLSTFIDHLIAEKKWPEGLTQDHLESFKKSLSNLSVDSVFSSINSFLETFIKENRANFLNPLLKNANFIKAISEYRSDTAKVVDELSKMFEDFSGALEGTRDKEVTPTQLDSAIDARIRTRKRRVVVASTKPVVSARTNEHPSNNGSCNIWLKILLAAGGIAGGIYLLTIGTIASIIGGAFFAIGGIGLFLHSKNIRNSDAPALHGVTKNLILK